MTIHLTVWWLFAIALVLILACGGDSLGRGLLLLLWLLIFLTVVACKVAAHFGLL